VSGSRFTRRQRLILTALSTAVVTVFALLGYAVFTTLQQTPPPPVSPLSTPISPLPSPTPTDTPSPSPTLPPLTPSPTATHPAPLSQIQSARAVREVGRIVAGVRDLPTLEQIPVTFPTEHEVAVSLLQRYQEEVPQADLALYAALGLIPPLDPPPLPDVTAQAARISSLYLPTGRQILLVAGRGPATPEDELALVHALAHALQDRAFSLEDLSPCQPTTDATLALRALIEGDAVLTTARYAGLPPDEDTLTRLARMAADAEEPTYAPLAGLPLFDRLRTFPYLEGSRWVAALYDDGGWEAVDRAYARVPCSTEQVLHPDRYLAGEPPQAVALPDLTPALGAGWTLLQRDTLGEWLVGLHLAAYLDDETTAWEAASGWAGDLFTWWQDEEGQEVLVWRTVWDDRNEAVQFEQAYRLLIPRFRMPPLLAAENPYRLPGTLWEGAAGAAYLVRTGRIVTVVWGPDLDIVVAIADMLP